MDSPKAPQHSPPITPAPASTTPFAESWATRARQAGETRVAAARDVLASALRPKAVAAYQVVTAMPDLDCAISFAMYDTVPADTRLFAALLSTYTYWPLIALGAWTHPAFVASLIMAPMLPKALFRRDRPFNDASMPYRGSGTVYVGADMYTFPSGHAWGAFALVWRFLPLWALPLGLAWACIVCSQRVMNGCHFLGDVLAGALMGLWHAQLHMAPAMEWGLAIAGCVLFCGGALTHGTIVLRPKAE